MNIIKKEYLYFSSTTVETILSLSLDGYILILSNIYRIIILTVCINKIIKMST